METNLNLPAEKPSNGAAGLKHWRHDIVAGLLVSLISLPFSLGIAVASGAPPIAGLTSAIIAGLILPFLGGSYVTISGPAAGLAPALLAAMLLLGKGNLHVGYPLLLGAICLTGCVQIVLAKFKAARFSALFPSAVVEGMLASIGLLIIAKQLPNLLGHEYKSHEFFGILAETPSLVGVMKPQVFFLGVVCLGLIFLLASLKARWMKAVPPQVIVVIIGVVMARVLHLDGRYLIHIPDRVFEHGIVLPNFHGLWADHSLWFALFTTVVTLTLIDGVESLATVSAIDKIDPYRRKSDPNRTLFAMGVSNLCSSLAGGLTIIPGGVKSTACIQGGGRTQWANFYNAIFLMIFLLFGRGVINLIPLSVLSAVLIYTGYKLCRPAVWRHIAHIGREQLVLFSLTVLMTLCTDLLWGIAFGVVVKLVMNLMFSSSGAHQALAHPVALGRALLHAPGHAADLFRNPVTGRELADGAYHLHFGRPLVCFNLLHVSQELASVPAEAEAVYLHLSDHVTLIDHTSCENLLHYADEFERSGRGHVEIVGLDRMRMRSHAANCMRVSAPGLVPTPGPADGLGGIPAH
jgi:carbonic anhydrase